MPDPFLYRFVWDVEKAAANLRKHGLAFEQAADVLRDPRAISIYDLVHSEAEQRWISLGSVGDSALLVVVHTFVELGVSEALVRIISAREATITEREQYRTQDPYAGEPMRREYDFSDGKRGLFFRKGAVTQLPIYLDADVREYFAARATAKGKDLDTLVNELLRRDIELIETAK